jgi:hypothetical protein
MLRTLACALALSLAPGATLAQDAEAAPDAETATPAESAPEPGTEEAPATAEAEPAVEQAPKIAVVVTGDPDEALVTAARRVERAIEGRLRVPFDPGLRAALRGEPGEEDDGLDGVRRERRRLGLEEDRDASLLSRLGRRAGASAVVVVRAGAAAAEVLVLDVRNAAFFEGELALRADVPDARIARFIERRAGVSARGGEIPGPAVPSPAEAAAAATAPTPTPPAQPDFFEQFWPYLVAGLLLVGMITAIVLTSTAPGSDQPVLRFVPGGR